MKIRTKLLAALVALPLFCSAAEPPKRLLVIGATAAFRHPSIPNWEIYLHKLESEFNGQVVMTFMSDAPNYPFTKIPTPNGGGGGGGRGRGGFPGQVAGASAELQAAITEASIPLAELNTAATTARNEVVAASLGGSAADIRAKVDALAAAESKLALARAEAVAKLQASANKLTPSQLQSLAGTAPAPARGGAGGGGPGGGNQNQAITELYTKYTSPEALKNYDGIFFISTTGNLPIPDEAAFLKWVAEGHGIMGVHATMDRGATSDAHMEMLAAGARFNGHPGNANAPSIVVRVDTNWPGVREFPDRLGVTDEFYSYHWKDTSGSSGVDPDTWIPGIDYSKVHALLNLDRGDGVAFPVAWVKNYGKGRVFYTSMGHRDDVFMQTISMDYDGQIDNSPEVNAAFKRHLMAGIRWSLGLIEADATPGNFKADPAQQVARSAATGGGGRGGPGGGVPAGGGRGAAPAGRGN